MAFDLAALFFQRQATATIRFARVAAVLKHFWDEEPIGFSNAEISDIEKRIDLQLPTALQEGLTLFGHSKGMNAQDQFIKSSDIRRINGRITFRIENQGVCMWAVERPRRHCRPCSMGQLRTHFRHLVRHPQLSI